MRTSAFIFLACIAPAIVIAQEDIEGASDHPKVPRIEGTRIVANDYADYDEGIFMEGIDGRQIQEVTAEGKRTRIVYLAPGSMSSLGILRNYQKAFSNLGNVTEVFSCRNEDCAPNLGRVFVWRDSKQHTMPYEAQGVLYSSSYVRNQVYWYATVKSADVEYHVSVYSAERTEKTYPGQEKKWPSAGQHLIHLEIVESDAFEANLEFVEASKISSSIKETGRIALYGIYFEFDSAEIQPDSAAMIAEIAKALGDSPDMNVYVVGHTDDQGTLQYNQDLSSRRSVAVVNEIVTMHGVDRARLAPVGVGPVAPVASNDTEDGRSLNRRVELVKQ